MNASSLRVCPVCGREPEAGYTHLVGTPQRYTVACVRPYPLRESHTVYITATGPRAACRRWNELPRHVRVTP